jgi:hypothetical protein
VAAAAGDDPTVKAAMGCMLAGLRTLAPAGSAVAQPASGAPGDAGTDASPPVLAADGAVYLLRELSAAAAPLVETAGALELLGELVASAAAAEPQLQETVWRQLPDICRALGKPATKRALHLFLGPLCECLGTDAAAEHRSRACAAGDCVAQLRAFIGPSIFAGRLTPEQAACIERCGLVPGSGGGGPGSSGLGSGSGAAPWLHRDGQAGAGGPGSGAGGRDVPAKPE